MSTKLYIGNLGPNANKTSLEQLFSVFGTVIKAYVITDRQTGQSKGFGFVEMSNDVEAQAAIAALNGKKCDGYTVKVNEAKTRVKSAKGNGVIG
jgi:cold-inducible RNA-binding protein